MVLIVTEKDVSNVYSMSHAMEITEEIFRPHGEKRIGAQ